MEEITVCVFCKSNQATKLCDFPTGVIKTTIDFKTYRMTCDRPICDNCAVNIAEDVEFCPHCMEKYSKKFINWRKELAEVNKKTNLSIKRLK